MRRREAMVLLTAIGIVAGALKGQSAQTLEPQPLCQGIDKSGHDVFVSCGERRSQSGPPWFDIRLNDFAGLRVSSGSEVLEFSTAQIMSALKAPHD